MIKMISAVSQNGIIGKNGKLPFNYPADIKHFRTSTANSTVIMGRKTYEEIGKPLPKRRNIVITSKQIDGIECYNSLEKALNNCEDINIWLIGGASIYEEGMRYAQEIHLTITPDIIEYSNNDQVTKFPWINPKIFATPQSFESILNDDRLVFVKYQRI